MSVPVDSRDDFDRTPLHTAVINKQTDIVRLLCDNFFAPIDTPDQSGRTPLHLAILNDYIDIAWLLRQRRARLDIFDDYGETPLDMIRGDFLTKWRINHGMLVDAKDPVTGNTAIIQASHQGNLNAVERLVVEKADINALNARRSTALAEACQEGHIAIVHHLLQAGADPNVTDISNRSALTHCILMDRHEALLLLLTHGRVDLNAANTQSRVRPLLEAVHSHNWTIVKILLEHGASPNFGPESPLRGTLARCNDESVLLDLISTFVRKGANVNLVDADGWSPVKEAVVHRGIVVLETLIKHGALVQGRIDDAPLVCWVIIKGADLKWLRLLEPHTVDIQNAHRAGWNALREAIGHGYPSHVRYLLELGMNANDILYEAFNIEHKGIALLAHAVWQSRENGGLAFRTIIPALIRHGALLEDRDSHGWTALRTAVEKDLEDVACLLLRYGADPTSKTPDGLSTLTVARNRNMQEFCALVGQTTSSSK